MSVQPLLVECLHQIASHFASDHSERKFELCKDLLRFLQDTPDVFDEPWTSRLSWTRPLFRGLFDIARCKTNPEVRSMTIEMTAVLTRGFNGFQWATESDKMSSKFVGLVSRLACLELSLLLDSPEKLLGPLTGSCLMVIEHSILTLVNDALVENLDPRMNPDEVCSFIDTLRETVIKIMDFILDRRDESWFKSSSDLPKECQELEIGLIRISCLLLSEDSTISPKRVERLIPVFADFLSNKSCYGLHHIIITGLIPYCDNDDIIHAVLNEGNVFLRCVNNCQECNAKSSLCQIFKTMLSGK